MLFMKSKVKSLIRKILSKIGLLTVFRIIKYKNYSNILHLKNAFVVGINQLNIQDNHLVSTGDDPQLYIYFRKKVNRLSINFAINHSNDNVELYYPNGVYNDFSHICYYTLGNCDGTEYQKDVYFDHQIKLIRLDLTKSSGKISIDDFEMNIIKTTKGQCYDEYSYILNNIDADSTNEKYVVVTHSMNETGAPILAYNISKEIKKKGNDVVVISLADGYLEREYALLNIPVINLHQSPISKQLNNVSKFEGIVKKLQKCGYNKVITNTIISGVTVPIFKKHNYKILSLIHEMKNSIEQFDMKQGGRNINFYSDMIVFPNIIVENEFHQLFDKSGNNYVICPQGLYKIREAIKKDKNSICSKYNIPVNSKIIFGSGTADFRKGIDLFLNAAMSLIEKEENFEYHFIWAGKISDKDLENWYKCQFDRIGISDRFHNLEFVKNKDEYQNLVECSDAFWLTSREDPFPSVMIEALEYGIPVFAFKGCGGADTLLADGRGALIDNFNLNELAIETHQLLKNEKDVEKMISSAQQYIHDNLDFNAYVDKLMHMFYELTDDMNKDFNYADVSVVVPNYNYEEYLPIRLYSIIHQSLKPKEIILLDDVSTDYSIQVSEPILKEAKAKYGIDYKIIKNDENNGCFRQWIKGLHEAKCRYVWIAEADDYAKVNFLETLIPKFDDEEVVLSYAKSCVINQDSDVVDYDYNTYTADLSKDQWQHDFIEDGNVIVSKYLAIKNVIPNVSSVVIRKSATSEIDSLLSNYAVIGDWLAYVYISTKGKIAYSNLELNGHRRHGKSIIAKQEKQKRFLLELINIKKYILSNVVLSNDVEINNVLLSMIDNGFDYKMINSDETLKKEFTDLLNICSHRLQKSNILIILPDFQTGGGQTVGIRLANSFTKYYNVYVVNAREKLANDFIKKMINPNVKVLEYNDDIDKLRSYNELLKFKSVISLIWWSDKLSYYAFGNMPVKRIISMHGCYENLLSNPDIDSFFLPNVEQMLKSTDYIVYTAEKNKQILEKYGLENNANVSKIDNGFVLGDYPKKSRSELGISNDEFVFGLVARGIPEKGYLQAIEALDIINKNIEKKAHLVLVGSGPYIDELKIKYSNQYIHFIDTFSQPLEWMGWEELFDVGLLPSYFKSESLPTVIVEYLFMGKPVISTNIAEIKSMLINDSAQAGLVIDLKDGTPDLEQLSTAMKQIMNDKELYAKLKSDTAILAERFNIDKCIDAYRKLIESDDVGDKNE